MRLRALAAASLLPLLLAACAGESGPSPDEQKRAELCAGFARLTPGSVEVAQAQAVLADPASTTDEKSAAMKVTLDQVSTSEKRTEPYDCDDPDDAAQFEWYSSDSE
ncbi:hypothetical protein [Rhodococcus aetherivorans]|uniref:hypothetical protein n=1 Tax=Rhodococcus aetherivorans TaxID=191292 RepID=UPI0002D240D7|nr:hypothetical protein [Rhodococcus aetherivorans]CCW14583.1 hypothetical protein EBESD8_51530 [Rhodococcus aetherivorans]